MPQLSDATPEEGRCGFLVAATRHIAIFKIGVAIVSRLIVTIDSS